MFTPTILGARESSKGYDADLTLFSPEGRLYQVEYVMRAVGQYGCPAVGVDGEGCCVVVCRRDVSDDLTYPHSVTSLHRVTDDIYVACTGMPGDVRYQVKRARLQALEYKRQYGSTMPSRLLALAMADAAQLSTQHAAMRPMACVSLFLSVDEPEGPLLFRVEPSGQFYQAWGTAAGRGSAASAEFLEEAIGAARDGTAPAVGGVDGEGSGGSQEPAPRASTLGGDGGNKNRAEHARVGAERPADPTDSAPSEASEPDEAANGGDRPELDETGAQDSLSGSCVGDSEAIGGAIGEERRREPVRRREGGFGVHGEDETVLLALQALSKASFGKGEEPPLTEENVEIAIASASRGIRVCSRGEVRGFLGRLPCAGN